MVEARTLPVGGEEWVAAAVWDRVAIVYARIAEIRFPMTGESPALILSALPVADI